MPWRLLRTLEHLLTGILISLVITTLRALGHPPSWQRAVVSWWHRRLCRILALEIQVSGQAAEHALLVANHISWLDIPVLGAQGPISFLSKAEVRRWPVIGWFAELAGTLFIERGAHQFAEVSAALRARITAGVSMVIFAEGTTSNGAQVLRFLPRLFAVVQNPTATAQLQASATDGSEARLAPLWLQPVALRYGQGPQPHPMAPFIDDDILVEHFWRILKHPGITVQITFLPIIDPQGRDRRTLAESARAAILSALQFDASVDPISLR